MLRLLPRYYLLNHEGHEEHEAERAQISFLCVLRALRGICIFFIPLAKPQRSLRKPYLYFSNLDFSQNYYCVLKL